MVTQGGATGQTATVWRSGLAVVLLALAQVLVVFDTTAFAVGIPLIVRDWQLSFNGLTWLLSTYSVCFAALPVLAVALGKAFGQRRVLMAGLVLSIASATAPAVASDARVLLASRAAQGIAAAAITSGALALIESTHPEGPGRARALNVHFAVVACAAPAVVLPCSVLLSTTSTERALFWVQAAAGAVLLLLTPLALTESEPARASRARVGGAALAVVPLGFLAWFADWLGGRSVSSTTVIVVAVAGALVPSTLGWFGRGEGVPALLARLYRERAAFGAYTVVTLLAAGLAGVLFVLTLALQVIGGLSVIRIGWALLPAVAGVVLGCLVLPPLAARAGLGATVAGASTVAATGFVLLSVQSADLHFADALLPLLLIAFGCGVLALPTTFARPGSDALPQGLNASRQLGAGLGGSLFVGIVTVTQQRMPATTLPGLKDYRNFLVPGVRACFELGAALGLTAAVVALLTLPGRGVRGTAPDPGVSGGAPAGTTGSPGSSGP
ncbi:MFS transporter [Streptomyces sp. MUM 16J]|uniref:MFS transporter n=1 Tax=Streptomyces sp. MUM 16J TaxID=2791988 RepID=UPI001F04BA92|nr:MFS transporter [Streptomyces sp. MUM 16J]MCH0556847.1 MFS transporter [Streptomyces sp. MUM 16J]